MHSGGIRLTLDMAVCRRVIKLDVKSNQVWRNPDIGQHGQFWTDTG
jgi:hypothetical protein